MERWGWSLVVLAGCLATNPPPPARTNDGPPPTAASAPPTDGGCFAGEWKGGGDDINHRHLGFTIALTQNGTALHGTFDYRFELGRSGTEEVSGTADCAAGTAELQGSKVTGDAGPAHYVLKLMAPKPLTDGRSEVGFEATWDCAPCTPGTMRGYTVR